MADVEITVASPTVEITPATAGIDITAPISVVVISVDDATPQVVNAADVVLVELEHLGPQGPEGPPYTPWNFISKAEDASLLYYGFARATGWQIKRKNKLSGSWSVASGAGDFDSAWADRANKSYGYY